VELNPGIDMQLKTEYGPVGSDGIDTARLQQLDVHFPGEHIVRMPLVKEIQFFSFPIPAPSIDTVYIRPLTEFSGEKLLCFIAFCRMKFISGAYGSIIADATVLLNGDATYNGACEGSCE
jgi:hypothetical protein